MTTTATQVAGAVTESMSLAAVRNFLRAAVSCITFTRGLCGDASFVPYRFAGVEMQQLCGNSVEGAQIISWLNDSAFDALNQKYLKEMALCVLSDDGTETLESYCFTVTYSADGGDRATIGFLTEAHGATQTALSAASQSTPALCESAAGETALLSATAQPGAMVRKRRTKEQIVDDMRALFSHLGEQISQLPPLLPDRVVTMRLLYNDRAPADYHPPNFQQASANMSALYRREVKSELSLGSVDAKHLSVTAAIRHPLYRLVRCTMPGSQGSAGTAATRTSTQSNLSGYRTSDTLNGSSAETGTSEDETTTHESCAATSTKQKAEPTRPPFAITATQLGAVRSVATLLSSTKALRPAEVCFLVFTAFIVTSAPTLRGGHGELSRADLERYLQQRCIFREVPMDTLLTVVGKLVKQKLMTVTDKANAWLVCDPPLELVVKLGRHAQVIIYLQPSELDDLRALEQRLGHPQPQQHRHTSGRKRPRQTPHSC